MDKTDYLNIDGRQLQILLTIQQAGSLSGAAKILDMNQSTMSYWLDTLRKRIGDPLFVRQGNGVVPTERVREILPDVQTALDHLGTMFQPQTYDPSQDCGVIRISTTAVERLKIIKPMITHALNVAPNLRIELHSQKSPQQVSEFLAAGKLDAALMPMGAAMADGLMQRKLFSTSDLVFFDPEFPLGTGDWDAFCTRAQVRVGFGPEAGFEIDRRLAKLGRKRHVALQVADFDSALAAIRGTALIATLPAPIAPNDLSSTVPPWQQGELEMALIWHVKSQTSERHRYWRNFMVQTVKGR